MNNLNSLKGLYALFLLPFFLLCGKASAQQTATGLPTVTITENATVHFVSPQKIRYVDISSHAVAGDLPEEKLLRIRLNTDSAHKLLSPGQIGIVTIVGENFMAQYRLLYGKGMAAADLVTRIDISPEQAASIDGREGQLSSTEMRVNAMGILQNRNREIVQSTIAYGIGITVNHIYTIGNNVFFDVSFENRTNLRYDVDEVRFKIEDRKIVKATNVQAVEIKPLWQLYDLQPFRRRFRNIYVLEKMSFPENKVLKLELTEKQVSGRAVVLKVGYKDILKADTF